MRVSVGKSPKREGKVYNGQMEERVKAGEWALGAALSRQAPQPVPEW